jgi:hypothetical protein
MMRERGLAVDHKTVWRWVQRYAPEINKRMRPHLKMTGAFYRLDETYVKVGTEWKYLYRAVDSAGDTIKFMLSSRRNVSAAKRSRRGVADTAEARFHYTPKHGSWLHLVEIELSVPERQSLNRRIPDAATLQKEVATYEVRRNEDKAAIT